MAPADQFAKSVWTLAAIAVVVAALYLAKGLLVPLTLAVLLSFLLSPVCDWLERRRLGRIPAVLLTAFVGFAILGAAVWTAVGQMTDLAANLPEYQENIRAKFQAVNGYVAAAMNQVTATAEEVGQSLPREQEPETPEGTSQRPYSVRVISSAPNPLQILGGTFGTLFGAFGMAGVVIVLVVFFLVGREDLRDRFIRLAGQGQLTMTTQMLEDAATRVSRYLSMLFVVNATYGLAVSVGLHLIGLPNAVLWGLLAAALRFIPYIGPWIAAAMPIGLSMAIATDWVAPLSTVALFVVLELVSNNVMEPWLYGKHTGMSAVAVLLAAVFWTWLWGAAGLLLATPLTVCLLVIGKHVPQLSFLYILLGNEPVFEPTKRVYQRLLAGDQEEATEVVEDDLKNRPLVEVYDSLLIPALALAETDWHRGELDDGRHALILQSLKEMIHERGDDRPDVPAPERVADGDSPRPCILCLAAHDEADEIAAMMAAQLLAGDGCLVQSVPPAAAAGAVVDLVRKHEPDVVCISSAPPAAVTHARRLCRQLRGRFPELPVVVGLWNAQGDLGKARARIAGGDATHVVATLAEVQEQVRRLIQPRLPPVKAKQTHGESDAEIREETLQ